MCQGARVRRRDFCLLMFLSILASAQDSGVVTPAAAAADPNYDAEFVRNTLAESRGGLMNALKKPIR